MPDDPTRLEDRVEAALATASGESFGPKYLDLMLGAWKDATDGSRRSATLMVVLVGAFLLLAVGDGTQITLGPLRVADTAAVLTFIPAIVSYLGYGMLESQAAAFKYQDLADATIQRLYPSFSENDLQRTLAPVAGPLWGDEPWSRLRTGPEGRLFRAHTLLRNAVAALVIFGVLVFLAYAYWWLFRRGDASTPIVAASLAFATLNVIRAIAYTQDFINLA
jgi:hypothetical protein